MRRVGGALAAALAIGLIVPASLGALPWSTAGTDPSDLIAASPPTAATSDTVETGPDDVAATEGNWSRLVFNASGPGGSWAYAYQPLPEPRDSISLNVSYDLVVDGEPGRDVAAFLAGPMAAIDRGDGFNVLDFPIDPPLIVGDGQIRESADRRFGLGVGAGQITGVGLAVAADAAWNVSVSVEVVGAEGPTTRPSYEYVNASGVRFYMDDQHLVPGVDDGASRVTLSGQVPGPGWTNVQVMHGVFQPVGVRNDDISLSDGTTYHRRSYRYGEKIGGCSVAYGGSYWPVYQAVKDLYGTYTGAEGEFRASIVDVGGSTDIGLAAVHLPIEPDDLPDGNLLNGYASGRFPCFGTR